MATGTVTKQTGMGRGARRRRRLFLVIVCGFSAWACLTLWEQTGAMSEKKDEMAQLQLKLDEVRADHENFQAEVTRLQDPEYIEQKARKDYGMVRPGDKVFDTPSE
ncbi:septum formation initiator family protein [Paenibacillus sp. TRM 82003]|nr:septum formation initiator family protein [Paenibacillus sp. TRM 82003]